MNTQILNNQIESDLKTLKEDIRDGLYEESGGLELYLKEAKRIADKMTRLHRLEKEEEANAVDLAVDRYVEEEKHNRVF